MKKMKNNTQRAFVSANSNYERTHRRHARVGWRERRKVNSQKKIQSCCGSTFRDCTTMLAFRLLHARWAFFSLVLLAGTRQIHKFHMAFLAELSGNLSCRRRNISRCSREVEGKTEKWKMPEEELLHRRRLSCLYTAMMIKDSRDFSFSAAKTSVAEMPRGRRKSKKDWERSLLLVKITHKLVISHHRSVRWSSLPSQLADFFMK